MDRRSIRATFLHRSRSASLNRRPCRALPGSTKRNNAVRNLVRALITAIASLTLILFGVAPATAELVLKATPTVGHSFTGPYDSSAPCYDTNSLSSGLSVEEGYYAPPSSSDATVQYQLSCSTPSGASVPGADVTTSAAVTSGSAEVVGPTSQATSAEGDVSYTVKPLAAGSVTLTVSISDPALQVPGQICNPSSLMVSACSTQVVLDFPGRRLLFLPFQQCLIESRIHEQMSFRRQRSSREMDRVCQIVRRSVYG